MLDAVASFNMWSWHALLFGFARSNNDINVLNQSPLFNEIIEDKAPNEKFKVNRQKKILPCWWDLSRVGYVCQIIFMSNRRQMKLRSLRNINEGCRERIQSPPRSLEINKSLASSYSFKKIWESYTHTSYCMIWLSKTIDAE